MSDDARPVGLLDAITLAVRAHAGHLDRGGEPYVGHLARVAYGARRAVLRDRAGTDEAADVAEQAAWLHDIVEDGGVWISTLESLGYPAAVVEAVRLVNRPPTMSYGRYLERLVASGNRIAILVKLADLADNLDPGRPSTAGLPESLRRRYRAARRTLLAALEAA